MKESEYLAINNISRVLKWYGGDILSKWWQIETLRVPISRRNLALGIPSED